MIILFTFTSLVYVDGFSRASLLGNSTGVPRLRLSIFPLDGCGPPLFEGHTFCQSNTTT